MPAGNPIGQMPGLQFPRCGFCICESANHILQCLPQSLAFHTELTLKVNTLCVILPLSFNAAEKGAPCLVRYHFTPSDTLSCTPGRLERRGAHRNASKSFAIQCSTGSAPFPPSSIFTFPFSPFPKSFRLHTFEISRKHCRQRTCSTRKFFRINTYEDREAWGCSELTSSCCLQTFNRSNVPTPTFCYPQEAAIGRTGFPLQPGPQGAPCSRCDSIPSSTRPHK